MNNNDAALAVGGISAPLWLPALNDWLGLVLVTLSIVLVIVRLWQTRKK